jgi:predicted MFS family arabinose efflux permease
VKISRNILLFVLAACLMAAAGTVFESVSNNYYDSVFGISAARRGELELPREFPGFMVAAVSGALFFLAEPVMGFLATGLTAAGLLGLAAFAFKSEQLGVMVGFLVVWSAGAHLSMPVMSSLALSLAEEENEGEKLGLLARARALAAILGGLGVMLYFHGDRGTFQIAFLAAAALVIVAGVSLLTLHVNMPVVHHGPRRRFVVRKRYSLFYLLSVLFGARKQMFITFGPWVLIQLYGAKAGLFGLLWMLATILSLVLMPTVGRLIDKLGERAVLMADAVVLLVVCLTYGFAQRILPLRAAFMAVCACFVLDQFLFGVQMARTTYLSKIVEDRSHISGTLSLGVSIDHAVSIPMAILGGYVWLWTDSHEPVFAGAAVVAALTFLAASRVTTPAREAVAPAAEGDA